MPQLIYFVVMLVLSYALQPKPPRPKAAAFEEFDFPTAEDGTPQIVVFGDVWLTDWTVIGVGNYRNFTIQSSTGGLFSKSVITGYRYAMSIHMGVCRGIDDLVEIKVSDKTAWSGTLDAGNEITININKPNLFGGDDAEGGIVGELIILKGASDQLPPYKLQYMFGNNIPAYRGVVTFFYDGLICSNSPYPKPWSFRVRRIMSNWDGSVWYPAKAVISMSENSIQAMNPAHIIYEAQTNRIWGRGFASSQLDLSSFQAAADQLYSEGFGLCLAWRRQESLNEFIQQIVDTIGAAMYLDRLTGLWKLVLVRDNYDAESLPTYNSSNGLLNILDDNNAANDISSNHTLVTFRDPITNQDQQIRAENIASIQKYGVISETKNYSGIPTQSIAGRVAARDMKISQSSLKKFKLEFDRRAYQMQPMSVFKINAPDQGIESIVLRAVRVEHNDNTNGKITVTAMQDVFGLAEQNFINSQPSLHHSPSYTAQLPTNYRLIELSYYDLHKQFFSPETLALLDKFHYLGLVAKAPTGLHLYQRLWLQRHYYDESLDDLITLPWSNLSSESPFAISITLAEIIPFGYHPYALQTSLSFDQLINIGIGSAAIIGEEIVKVLDINTDSKVITLGRGCAHSMPVQHDVGQVIWFYEDAISLFSKVQVPMNNGSGVDEIRFQIETFTKFDSTPKDLATNISSPALGSILGRSASLAERPYPPAKVLFNNQLPTQQYLQKSLESITWFNRNRTLQADSLIDQTVNIVPMVESGTWVQIDIEFISAGDVYTYVSHIAQPTDTSVNISVLYPISLTAHTVNVRVDARKSGSNSADILWANFELYGFGVNFGNHFGGI